MKNDETSAQIAQWAESVFGPASPAALIQRARLELAELEEAAGQQAGRAEIVSEITDVAILLHRLAALHGATLTEAVNQKMRVNRQRRWIASGDGTGRHQD